MACKQDGQCVGSAIYTYEMYITAHLLAGIHVVLQLYSHTITYTGEGLVQHSQEVDTLV